MRPPKILSRKNHPGRGGVPAHPARGPSESQRDSVPNPAHPAGGSKAWFFLRFGFTVAEWPKLADALMRLARENEVVETEQTPHGRRYVVDGRLIAPDGTGLNIRTAWYIDAVGGAPRFVTAHPLPK